MQESRDKETPLISWYLNNSFDLIAHARHLTEGDWTQLEHGLTVFPSLLPSTETDALGREASERFAAGYIQCMHEVHTFVSGCPGIDPTVAAELLNHLLECMPLNEDHLQDVLMDLITDTSGSTGGAWHGGDESMCSSPASPGGRSLCGGSSPSSSASSEDLCSDLDETDSEHNQSSTEASENREALCMPTGTYPRSMWRPW